MTLQLPNNAPQSGVSSRASLRGVASGHALLALGLGIRHEVLPAGEVILPASGEHRLRIHAGAPVQGHCSTTPFVYERGDLDLMPAGEGDRWEQKQAASVVTLSLSPRLLMHAAEDLGVDTRRASLSPRHQVRDARIEHIVWALEAERAEGFPSGELFAGSLATALAVHLLGHGAADSSTRRGLSPRTLQRVTDYIEAHLDRELSLERLARVADLSVTQLKALFRKSTGMPVHAFVVQRRVERARALLVQSDLPVAQVALEAGFAHQSHMARWMKRVLGVTPSSLRRGG